MSEAIGIRAILDTGQFDSGLSRYLSGINKAEGATRGAASGFSGFGSILPGLGGQFASLGQGVLNFGLIAGGAALAGVTALTAGLITLGVTGVNKAVDLDAQMATIAATMNTTKAAVGPLKDLILDLALDPKLTVTATQAADAIQLLAQNGVTMKEIMDGAAKSTVALANATGAEFGTAANIASGVMKVFNIDAKDMGTAIDGITGVVNQSKFSIDDYGQAFAQAGGVAAGMGLSLQDFNTIIAASADSFNSGSDAGTSFKTMLQRLANPTDEAKAAMQQYGISLFDAEGKMRPLSEVAQQLNNVFQGTATITSTVGGATKKMTAAAESAQKVIPKLTSDIGEQEASLKLMQDELGAIAFHYGEGSLRARKQQLAIDKLTNSLNENRGKLVDYQGAIAAVTGAQAEQVTSTKTLTEAEKAELAAVIGGADASRSVLALSQLTSKEFDTLSGKVNDVGQAFRAAATRVDSAKGAMAIFQGIIEAIQIQVGDKFLPLLRGVTVGFADLATKIGPKVVDFFGRIAGKITSLVDAGKNIIDIFGDKGLAGVFAFLGLKGSPLFLKKLNELGGQFGLVGDGASSLGDTIKGAFKWVGDNLLPMLSTGLTAITGFVTTAKGLFAAFMAGGLFGGTKSTPGGTVETGGLLAALGLNDIPGQLQNLAGQVLAAIPGVLTQITSGIATFLTDNWPTISASLTEWTTKFWDWAKNAAAGTGAAMAGVAIALLAWAMSPEAQVATSQLGQTIGTMITNAIALAFVGGEGAGLSMGSLMIGLGTAIASMTGSLIILGGQIVAGILSGILESLGISLQPATFSQLSGILTGIGANIKTIASVVGKNIVTAIKTGWDNTVKNISDAFQDGVDSWMTIITETKWAELGEGMIAGVLKGINDNVTKVYEKLKGMALEALAQAGQAIGWNSPAKAFIPLGASIPQGMIVGIQSQIANLKATLDQLNTGIIHNSIGAARDDLEKFFDASGVEGSKTDLALRNLNALFHQNADEILSATDRAAAFEAIIERQARNGFSFGFLTEGGGPDILSDAVKTFVSAFDKALGTNKEKIKQLKEELRQLQIQETTATITTAGSLIDLAQSSANRLSTQVDTLAALLNTGATEVMFEGQLISAAQAQDLLNGAMQEQVDIQDDLLALQQAQSQLGFLQTQLDLINQLNAAGLDATSILGDLNLGANASMADIVEASNRAIQALIGQAEMGLSGLGGIVGSQPVGGAGTPVTGTQPASNRAFNLTINGLNVSNGMDVNSLISLIQRTATGLA